MAESTSPTSSITDELVSAGLSKTDAETLSSDVIAILSSSDKPALEKWRLISKQYLTPQQPFAVHQYLFKKTYDACSEPHFIWIPSEQEMQATNLYKYMQSQNQSNVRELFAWADANREAFWKSMVQTLHFEFAGASDELKSVDPSDVQVFELSKGVESVTYFPGLRINAADVILTGDDNRTAIVWSKEGRVDQDNHPILHTIRLGELKQSAAQIAHQLTHKLRLTPGDAVGIAMPMTWQSVAIYLGILKAGMAVVSIADSFAPAAIQVRLEIADAKAVFTQDVIARGDKQIPLYERVVKAHARRCIVLAEADDGTLACTLRDDVDVSWQDFLAGTDETTRFASVACDSMAVANILFSSGTTGDPKAIPWHHATFIKPLVDGYLHNDVRSGEVVAWPTNIGWMMGPWLIAQMGLNAAIALFVGSPVGPAFCSFVERAGVHHLGVIPSMVKSWMKLDATRACDWRCVRRFSSTGEASNPTLYHWLVSRAHYSPVMEYVGGTEIAGGYLGGTMCQPQLLSSFSAACFGLNIHVIDEHGAIVDAVNGEGELSISPPSCGLSVTLLNRSHQKVYYDGMPRDIKDEHGVVRPVLRRHGDQIRIVAQSEAHGTYYQHLGRVDDTMNLGGIKISSVALENVIVRHPLLSREVAAIAYRQSDVDQEELVICCVPKAREDFFAIRFESKPLLLQLAPAKDNERITVVYGVDNGEFFKPHPQIKEQPVVYKIDEQLVYDTLKFEDVVQYIKNAQLGADKPMTVWFLRQSFNPHKVQKELQTLVKTELNPLFRVRDVFVVESLPRTASGKVMRRVLRTNYSSFKSTK